MTQSVVDLFELVQVDQHDRKWTSRTRSALPLRRQRLPEEAPRLDSSQAIRDRLLLQFLKNEGVVQGSGQKVGKRVEDENVLWGKSALIPAFDVQRP